MCRKTRRGAGAVALGAMLVAPALQAQDSWTLSDALSLAWSNHPDVRTVCADRQAAEADLLDARVFPHNPEIEVEGADRRGADDSTTDRGLTVSQRFELGGRRSRRIAVASSALAETDARLLRRLREHRARLELAFTDALTARRLLRVAQADLDLTRELLSFEEKRLEAGAGTALDVRLARTAVGRATRELQRSEAAYAEARSRLAEAAGVPTTSPEPVGDLTSPARPSPDRDALSARALATRSDLAALDRRRETARRRLTLERSRKIPDLEVSAFTAREEGDDVTGLGVGISLPLFDRNQGGVARAESEVARADASRDAAELKIRQRVAATVAQYESAVRAFDVLDTLVVESLEETLGLLEQAFREGEVSATEVLVLRRELVDGRREHVEATRDVARARIELDRVTGHLDVPTLEEVCHAMD